jgi:uncharacterized protein YbaR (Trm112 family)
MKKCKDFEVSNDMSTPPKTISLKCPVCKEIRLLRLWRTLDGKVEYICEVCRTIYTISKETAMSEEKRKIWNMLSDIYRFLDEGAGKIGFACYIASHHLHDDKLARRIDMLLRDAYKIKEELWERLKE